MVELRAPKGKVTPPGEASYSYGAAGRLSLDQVVYHARTAEARDDQKKRRKQQRRE